MTLVFEEPAGSRHGRTPVCDGRTFRRLRRRQGCAGRCPAWDEGTLFRHGSCPARDGSCPARDGSCPARDGSGSGCDGGRFRRAVGWWRCSERAPPQFQMKTLRPARLRLRPACGCHPVFGPRHPGGPRRGARIPRAAHAAAFAAARSPRRWAMLLKNS